MMRMADKRHDPLEAAKIGPNGEPPAIATGRQQAAQLTSEATEAFPDGVPQDSPYFGMTRDALLGEGNRVGMTLGPLMKVDDLRLCLHHWRFRKIASTPVASTPVGAKPLDKPAPVPMHQVRRKKLRGVPPSDSNTWIVTNKDPKNVSIAGQVCTLRNGAKLELRHYNEQQIESLVQQGIELKAYASEDDDEYEMR